MVTAAPAAALPNRLALTPPMGFNNWNSTRCGPEFGEDMVKAIADLFVTQGLRDAGYTYVNLDDCWALPERDGNGDLVADPARFPHGIKAVADHVHSKGLKFGVYSSAGTRTCSDIGFPGSLGHERQDAALWASWGVDYLKYDNCHNDGVDARTRYQAMGDALRATGRTIAYSICEWGYNRPWTWARETGNSWRTTEDILDSWSSMIDIAHQNQALAPYAAPGAWNDPDMLEVGNGGMTDTEYRTHFSLWAQMAAPLLIGTDLREATPATLGILTNKDVIAVDQDPLGRQGTVIADDGGLVVMSRPLADGSRSLTLTNETDTERTMSTTAAAAGIGGAREYTVKDLWSGGTTAGSDGTINVVVPPHGTAMYRVTPSEPTGPPPGAHQLGDLAWTSADNTAGPVERNHSNGGAAAGDGRPLTVAGVTHPRGLGVGADSDISYHLGRACRNLTVDVGVDDETTTGSVRFRVYRDDDVVADQVRRAGQPALRLSSDLTGAERLRIVTTGQGGDAHGDWAGPRLTCGPATDADAEAAPTTRALTELPWSFTSNAWGPVEVDRSNGEQATGDGRPLTVGGEVYATGLGTHAASYVVYDLGGTCTSLTTDVGIDDEVGATGSALFHIYADGVKVAGSGRLTGADGHVRLTARLDGARTLLLHVTDADDGAFKDHTDWAAPRLTCS
ncbi:NPCBM/NEW2 domain-containing protein [Kitasatospora sp. NPDC004240]